MNGVAGLSPCGPSPHHLLVLRAAPSSPRAASVRCQPSARGVRVSCGFGFASPACSSPGISSARTGSDSSSGAAATVSSGSPSASISSSASSHERDRAMGTARSSCRGAGGGRNGTRLRATAWRNRVTGAVESTPEQEPDGGHRDGGDDEKGAGAVVERAGQCADGGEEDGGSGVETAPRRCCAGRRRWRARRRRPRSRSPARPTVASGVVSQPRRTTPARTASAPSLKPTTTKSNGCLPAVRRQVLGAEQPDARDCAGHSTGQLHQVRVRDDRAREGVHPGDGPSR